MLNTPRYIIARFKRWPKKKLNCGIVLDVLKMSNHTLQIRDLFAQILVLKINHTKSALLPKAVGPPNTKSPLRENCLN